MPFNDLFLRACRGEAVTRPPLWIMRQAGRYLPEYREVRQRCDFLTLCRTPELACEVTLQPVRRFGFDAAIVFSDIMMPLEALGVRLDFDPGPIVQHPIRSAADVDALARAGEREAAPFVMETIRLLRGALEVPLIGFAGAPLTLAAYLVEGRGSKDFAKLRAFMHAQPAAAHALMNVLADTMAGYLAAQIRAGAQAIQLFDTWAGILGEATYRAFALPAVQRIMAALAPMGVPRIYFAPDAAALLPAVRQAGADVWGVDWRLDLRQARAAYGADAVLQGNLDPAALFATPATVRAAAKAVLESAGGPHVFNLGHGILPETPIASVEALVGVVQGRD